MHKVAFQAAGLTVHWYGVFVAAGFLTALWTAARRAPLAGLPPEKILDLGPWLMVGAIVGARALYVISYWEEHFAGGPLREIFMVQHGGLVFYGGLIGASLATIIFARIKKVSLWLLADVLAPSIALGHGIGRFGCLMNGCCYGRPTGLPWGICFPPAHQTGGVPVHPTQVYEALLNFAIYFFLAWRFRARKFRGEIFALYLILYAVMRACVEVFRGDYEVHYLGGIATPGQLLSAAILAMGLVLFRYFAQVSRAAPRP